MIIVAKSPARTIKVSGNRVAVLGVGRQGPAGTPLHSHQLLDVESSSRPDQVRKALVCRTAGVAKFDALDAADIQTGTLDSARLASIDATKIANGTVGNTEFQALNGVTSSIQTQLDDKASSSHQHSGADITSGTVAPARLGSGTPTSSTLLDGSGAWRPLAATDIPNLDASKINSGILAQGQGGTGFASYTLGDLLYSSAANTLAKLSGNTTTAKQFLTQTGTGTVSAAPAWATIAAADLPNHSAALLTSGTLDPARVNGGTSSQFLRGDGTYSNTLTGGITLGGVALLGNAGTATDAANCIVGTASGVQINAPTGSSILLSTNGTARETLGLNGLVFAGGASAASSGNISIGSGAPNTMTLNVPNGGLYLFGEAATSGVVISAASKYLQFLGPGGILGAAGNAGYCYLAGGNVASNTSCAYIRTYAVSAASNAGQALYALGNATGAKHSFLDKTGVERLKIDENAITALGPLVTPTATPASASATGTAGQWAWDSSYIYICVATNTWRRLAHATW